ncbi:hypothetical protein [Kingella potus]|uniref:hypothetical protein n=1 Tax=Kingella potus TaxID=265175 RepID=UPI001FD14DE9|nr:hypothetical protein [Kingella potus]UOP00058.1 hypothetical protein LVJ84_08640 [Kingella potus]
MNPKMFVQPAIRISIIAAVIAGILILFGVRWWIALLSVVLAVRRHRPGRRMGYQTPAQTVCRPPQILQHRPRKR